MNKIYLNGRFLTQRQTGVQRYSRETLQALDDLLYDEQSFTGCSFHLLVPENCEVPLLRAVHVQRIGPLTGHLWEQFTLPWAARDGLLWSFGPTGPLLRAHQAVTIHDATVRAVPEAFSWHFRTLYGLAMPLLIRRTAQVMTVSRFSRDELVRLFGAQADALRISGEGWQHAKRIRADASILTKHQLERGKYVLAVSSVTPHKNFAVVERAMQRLASSGYRVVIAGGVDPRIFGDSAALKTVEMVGYVSDSQLRALYEGAGAFVYPSLYEGFGLPPLEAMAYGCPVIASRAASMPEVCGEGAQYFEPHDDRALADLIHQVLTDQQARDALIEGGRRQLAKHDWCDAARAHLAAMHAALARSSTRAPSMFGKLASSRTRRSHAAAPLRFRSAESGPGTPGPA
jgi:glycosyltransferase involved in cell wall biosynthesis